MEYLHKNEKQIAIIFKVGQDGKQVSKQNRQCTTLLCSTSYYAEKILLQLLTPQTHIKLLNVKAIK